MRRHRDETDGVCIPWCIRGVSADLLHGCERVILQNRLQLSSSMPGRYRHRERVRMKGNAYSAFTLNAQCIVSCGACGATGLVPQCRRRSHVVYYDLDCAIGMSDTHAARADAQEKQS
jgi:hypothetical protein